MPTFHVEFDFYLLYFRTLFEHFIYLYIENQVIDFHYLEDNLHGNKEEIILNKSLWN